MIHSAVLANGLRVLILEKNDSPVFSAGIFVRQGSRNESENENGISHFLEHLVCNSQRAIRRGKKVVEELINNGGVLSAFTTKECTSFEGIALNDHYKLLLECLYELIFNSTFTDADIDDERQIILAELKRKQHGTDQLVDYLVQGLYDDTGYGKWILGTEEFIMNVKQKQLEEKYREVYIADNTALVVITSLNSKEVFAVIEELFSRVPSGLPNPIEVDIIEQVNLKVLRQKSNHAYICLGGFGPSIRDQDSSSFELAINAWGNSPNSRLFMSAREKHGLVYHIQSFYRGYIQTGHWGVYASVSKENIPSLLKVIFEEVEKFHLEPLNDKEVRRITSTMKTQLHTMLYKPEQYLRLLGRRGVFREVVYPNETVREYELTTSSNIQDTVKKFINKNSISMVIMGDIESELILKTMNEIGV
ncbi:M16 family metallopeptidase [Bacillus cereus]|uniref:M16 family metallopeptidase n=1 Tax=Bacillus cereus TaxID=1396 RepID=UPI0025AF7446|nr:pitrilysin family protein [Bacillus cereus]MDA2092101.1 pitrilysin family protein [Bacillus cereus]WJX06325.1 pitrilysin family protein [Bacillus cereus]